MSTTIQKFIKLIKANHTNTDQLSYVKIVKDVLKNYDTYEQFFMDMKLYTANILTANIIAEILYYYYNRLTTLLKTRFLSALISKTFSSYPIIISGLTFLLENIIKTESHTIIVQSIQQSNDITMDLLCFIDRISKIDWIYTKGTYTDCNLPEYIVEYASRQQVETNDKVSMINGLLYIFQTSLTEENKTISYHFNVPLLLIEIFQNTYDINLSSLILKCFSALYKINIVQADYERQYHFFEELKIKSFSTIDDVKLFIRNKLNLNEDLNRLENIKDKKFQYFLAYINNNDLIKQLLQDLSIPQKIKDSYFTDHPIVITSSCSSVQIHSCLYNKNKLEDAIELFDLICIPHSFEYLINDMCNTDNSYKLYMKVFSKCKEAYKDFKTYSNVLPEVLQNEIFDYVCSIKHTRLS